MQRCLLPLLLCITLSLDAQETPNYQFQGKVHWVTEHSYKAKSRHGQVVKGKPAHEYSSQSDFQITYDSTQLMMSRTLLLKSGEFKSVTIYYYDQYRVMTRQYTTTNGQSSSVDISYSNEYDRFHRMTKRTVRRKLSDPVITYFYVRDSSGNIHEKRDFGEDPGIKTVETRQFDSLWHLTKEWVYSSTGKLLSWHEYSYNSLGYCTWDIVHNPSDQIIVQYHWIYGENDELINYEVCTGSLYNCAVWSYKYEYDSHHNWVRCVEYRNGKPAFIKEREIIYF